MNYYILSIVLFITSLNAISYEKSENIVIDTTNKLMWQDNEEVTQYLETFISANVYCENIILNGYIDWRVPSIEEVVKIIDVKNTTSIRKEFQNVQPEIYTTYTPFIENSQMIWGVNFEMGNILLIDKDEKKYIRCVRDI